MLLLVVKDFRANWRYVIVGLLVLLAMSTSFMYTALKAPFAIDPDLLIYFLLVLVSSMLFSLLFLMIDQVNQVQVVFASLPVSRKQLVVQRYVATYVQFALALVVHFLGLQLGIYSYGITDHAVLAPIYNPLVWLVMLLILTNANGLFMPFYVKHGLRKGLMILGGIQCFFWISFVYVMISFPAIWDALQTFIFTLISYDPWLTIPMGIGGTCLVTWVSTQISSTLFKSKDL